jgi:hypothetical protein
MDTIINQVLADLQEADIELENALAGLDETTAGTRPKASSWSVTLCVEHLTLNEQSVLNILRKEPDIASLFHTGFVVYGREKLRARILDRSKKIKLPEGYERQMGKLTLSEGKEKLLGIRNEIRGILASGKIAYPELIVVHPGFGNMTKVDWLLILPAHSLRHTEQIREIKRTLHSGG